MSEKKVGKRLLTWVLVLVMTLSLLPLNVLASPPVEPAMIIQPDANEYLTYQFYVGGKMVDEQIVKDGNTLLAPETPKAAEGQRFIGWYDENDALFTGFGKQSGITESKTITLHARFEEVYYVFFHAPGENGNIVKTKEGTTGKQITVDDVIFPVEHEESITGWYTDKNYAPETKVKSVTLGTANVDLYAKVEQGLWITFDSNGGSYVAPQFVTDKTTKPADPTRAGFTFDGWLLNGAAFTFGNKLDDDITLTAEWTAKDEVSYTVIHWQENANNKDYSCKESETKSGAAGALTTAKAKSYEGFTAPQSIEQKTIAGDGSTIVNVKYKRNVYEVKFYDKKGKTEYKELTITAKFGTDISTQWPTYNGSSTWRTKPNGTTCQSSIQTMPLNGANFYGPKTGKITETAYYYLQVLPGHEQDPHVKEYNGKYYKKDHEDTAVGSDLSITDEDHYNIAGFIFREYEATKFFLSNKYHYNNAKFYYDRIDYKFTFKNGEVETPFTKKYQESLNDLSNKVTPTAPAGKEGYDFAGWYSNELCQGDAFNFDSTMPAQNIIVYAKWAAPVHTVTFKVDGQPDQKLENIAHKDTITLPENPTPPAGEEFLGWTYQDGKPFNPETEITDNLTLYAKFGSRTGYGVTYDTKDGNGKLVNDSNRYGKDAAATVLDGAHTAPTGKVFLYWKDSDGNKYYPNNKITINDNVTLTAVYGETSKLISITYYNNFGTPYKAVTVPDIPNNGLITVKTYDEIGLAKREGYTFAGWNTKDDGTGDKFEADENARVDNTETNDLYAQWTPATDTKYKVEHYQQNLADNEYTLKGTDNLTGTTGEDTKAAAMPYPGFTAQAFDQQPIAANGSTVIKIYYNRNEYTVTYQYDGTVPAGASKLPDAVKYKFGAEVTVAPAATATGYTFSGWTTEDATIKEGKFEMPAKGVKLTGSFVKDDTQWYTVKYTWTGVPEGAEPPVTPPTDSNTYLGEAAAKNAVDKKYTSSSKVTGSDGYFYTFSGWDGGTVNGQVVTFNGSWTKGDKDNSKWATVTFNSNGGSTVDPQTVKCNDKAKEPPAPTKSGYTFAGWYTGEPLTNTYDFGTPVTKNIILYAKWNTNYVPYYPPVPPTVKIEDDDALGLNTTDHFAYIVGYGNGEVRPQNNITRAEVATIFFRLLTDDVRDENLTKTNRYSDVAATSWYNTAVSTLSSMGIITGYPDGTFRPNAAITRAEFAAIAARFDNDGDKTAAKFSDIATHWAKDEISIAYNNGWINGYPDGTFGPQRDITRAETMTLVNRVLNRQPETEDDLLPNMTVWTDNANPKAWYYLAVQEATNSHYYKFKTNSKYEKWTELRETRDWTQLEK